MTNTRISETLTRLVTRAIKSSRLLALAMVTTFTSLAIQPAQAQSADTWKSIAIIGGSTVAGAYVGHKIGGSGGAWVGAAVGASTGYAIDRRRRSNEYYNQYGDGYYGNNDPYYGNNDPYYGNGGYGGYNGGSYNGGAYPYPAGYQSNTYSRHGKRCSRH